MYLSFNFSVLLRSYITHTVQFGCCQDQSEASTETEPLKVSLNDKESKEDNEMPVDEPDKDETPVDDSDLVESGKKDPFVRRQELLIKSGLAEVGCFSYLLVIISLHVSFLFCCLIASIHSSVFCS